MNAALEDGLPHGETWHRLSGPIRALPDECLTQAHSNVTTSDSSMRMINSKNLSSMTVVVGEAQSPDKSHREMEEDEEEIPHSL